MDRKNVKDLQSLTIEEEFLRKIHVMTEFNKIFKEEGVPDPYYGGYEGSEYVLDLLEDACSGLLSELEEF